jgi:hypothetical protein
MGGGGFLGLGPAPSAPEAPDYTGAAQATAQGNLQAAQANTAANRVSQYTPYGSLQYAQNGTDTSGNPMWSATTSLSPTGQALLDAQNNASLGLANLFQGQLGKVSDTMNQGFDTSKLPQVQTNVDQAKLQTQLGGTGMQGWDKASGLIMSRLAPTIQHQNEMSDAQLANQGIVAGTEAYDNAKRVLAQSQNDLLNQAQLAGQQVQQNLFGQNLAAGQFGNAANQQMFANRMAGANLNNTAQQQAYNQALTNYQLPLNMLSALRTGAQVTNPTFVNTPNQAVTAGADLLGATQMGSNYNLANFNAANASQGGLNSGLFGLGAAGIMAMSDIRTKENIRKIGELPNGLNVYEYEYKDEFKNRPFAGAGKHIGVMAQEVFEHTPEAVTFTNDGYMMVNYGALNG